MSCKHLLLRLPPAPTHWRCNVPRTSRSLPRTYLAYSSHGMRHNSTSIESGWLHSTAHSIHACTACAAAADRHRHFSAASTGHSRLKTESISNEISTSASRCCLREVVLTYSSLSASSADESPLVMHTACTCSASDTASPSLSGLSATCHQQQARCHTQCHTQRQSTRLCLSLPQLQWWLIDKEHKNWQILTTKFLSSKNLKKTTLNN